VAYHLIEFDTRRLGTYRIMDVVFAKFLESDEVVDGFAARLDAERCGAVANVEPLTIYRTETDAKLLWIHLVTFGLGNHHCVGLMIVDVIVLTFASVGM